MTLNNAARRYLPMTETMYYILLSLTEPRHGYGILLNVKDITSGRIRLGAGTIYNSLSKLEKDGLIELVAETERRKIYLICDVGRELLGLELTRLEELCENGRKFLKD